MKYPRVICLLGLLLSFVACSTDDGVYDTSLPYAPVRLTLYPYGEDYQLLTPTSVLFVEHPLHADERIGHGGIVVVHTLSEGRHYLPFAAFDMACPLEYPSIVPVRANPHSEVPSAVVCPMCGTVYDLLYGWGAPISGPGRIPLQQYSIRETSDRALFVFN